MKLNILLTIAALAASTLLPSCETVQQAVNKVVSSRDREQLSGLAQDVVKFGETTGVIDQKYLTAIKLADKLVLKQDGTVTDAFVLASQQLVDKALMEKKLTEPQVRDLYSIGTVPLSAPATDVPSGGPKNDLLPSP